MNYRIPAARVAPLQKRVDKLNKTAAKLGVGKIELVDHGQDYKQIMNALAGTKQPVLYHEIEVRGEVPTVNGWKIIGKLEVLRQESEGRSRSDGENVDMINEDEVLVFHVNGDEEVPAQYRDPQRARSCDHCNLTRNRLVTYVLRRQTPYGDKEFLQHWSRLKGYDQYLRVGSTCMEDFVPGGDALAKFTNVLCDIRQYAKAQENAEVDFANVPMVHELDHVLSLYCGSPHKIGHNTSSHPPYWVHESELKNFEPSDEGRQKAQKIKEWVSGMSKLPDVHLNDYFHNLVVAFGHNYIEGRLLRLVKSSVAAYDRHLAQRISPTPEHVGVVGQRLQMEVECVGVFRTRNDYVCHKFRTESGNPLAYFGVQEKFKEGAHYKLRFTIKAHGAYRGAPSTIISYPLNMATSPGTSHARTSSTD